MTTTTTLQHAQGVFEQRYVERTGRSREHYRVAGTRLPGGVPGNAAFRQPHPLYVTHAEGTRIWDIDGNRYLDLLIGGGPHILGHSPPVVVEAVQRQLSRGTSTLAPSQAAYRLAEKIHAHMPHMEMLRYVSTGSEAMHMAMRVSRAFTGRQAIGKFEGNFHGGYDNELVSGRAVGGDLAAPTSVPDGAGIPRQVLQDTVVLPYNNAEHTVALIEQHAEDLAAVVIEPIACTWMGGVPADADFLREVREVTRRHGILLIFDEIVTGFRVALGGAAKLYGIEPDLTALAKIIGGGFPLGAFGGRADVMDAVLTPATDPSSAARKAFHSGTFQSNLVALTAGLTTIEELERPGVLKRANAHGDRLRQAMVDLSDKLGLSLHGTGHGSIVGFHFGDAPMHNLRDVLASDRRSVATMCMGLVAHGIYITPYHLGLTNAIQTDDDIDEAIGIVAEVMTTMAGD